MRATAMLPIALLLAGCGGASGPTAGPSSDAPAAKGEPAPAPVGAGAVPPPPDYSESMAARGHPRLDDLVTAEDTLASLRERFGEAQVAVEMLPGAEGETFEGWALFPGEPTRRVDVHLDESGRRPALLIAGADNTTHMRRDGVVVGMNSLELEQLNGRPFDFAGFDWDYGGVVLNWRGGRLGAGTEGTGAGPVRLCPHPESLDARPAGYPMGDRDFSSSLPVMRSHPAVVCEVGLRLEPKAAPAE